MALLENPEGLTPYFGVDIPSDPEEQLNWVFDNIPLPDEFKNDKKGIALYKQRLYERLRETVDKGTKYRRRKEMVEKENGTKQEMEIVYELDDEGNEKPLPYKIKICSQ